MVAVPDTTLHAIDTIGWIPVVAVPLRVNVAEPFALHMLWSGPASAVGPIFKLTGRGLMKSTMVAVGDCDSFVFTRIVLIPTLNQGSMPARSAVKSTAPSAKVLAV